MLIWEKITKPARFGICFEAFIGVGERFELVTAFNVLTIAHTGLIQFQNAQPSVTAPGPHGYGALF